MVNFYRDMWKRRSHMITPLTELTSIKSKSKFVEIWSERHTHAFNVIKEALARDVLLAYPDFSKPFHIHTDASDYQLGSVISQDNKPLAFYSRKLSTAQRNYTTIERELLSIHENLREYRSILLGHEIHVYTDHQNLLYENKDSGRVQRWRILMEEFGPILHYIKGEKNIVADTISRLEKIPANQLKTVKVGASTNTNQIWFPQRNHTSILTKLEEKRLD